MSQVHMFPLHVHADITLPLTPVMDVSEQDIDEAVKRLTRAVLTTTATMDWQGKDLGLGKDPPATPIIQVISISITRILAPTLALLLFE